MAAGNFFQIFYYWFSYWAVIQDLHELLMVSGRFGPSAAENSRRRRKFYGRRKSATKYCGWSQSSVKPIIQRPPNFFYPNSAAFWGGYDNGTPTKLNFTTQNSYEMVSLNNIRCLKSAETDNFSTTYILRMFTLTRTNGTR